MSAPHVSEDDLVLFYYGEPDAPAGVETHLATCPDCQGSYASLALVLNAVRQAEAPERDVDYGRRVFERLAARLHAVPGTPSRGAWFMRRTRPLLALAATLVVTFLLGRYSREPVVVTVTQPGPVRERVLLVAVGDHLDRSRMVLAELVHARGNGTVDISSERGWAQDLVAANRLYRQAALHDGEGALASVLDELGRVLVEVATSPDDISSADIADLREHIEAQGILFKIKVLGTHVRKRQRLWVSASAEVL